MRKEQKVNYSLSWKSAEFGFDSIKEKNLRLISMGVLTATPEKLSTNFSFKIVKGDSADFQERL
jgi:hypothetical protein